MVWRNWTKIWIVPVSVYLLSAPNSVFNTWICEDASCPKHVALTASVMLIFINREHRQDSEGRRGLLFLALVSWS
jgi:hypothetical protein